MDELPENAVDVIEDMSRELKGSILQEKQDTLRDSPSSSAALLLAEQQTALFTRAAVDEGDHEEDLVREYVGPAPWAPCNAFYFSTFKTNKPFFVCVKYFNACLCGLPLQQCNLF